ncbi:MAG: glutamine amidotransferase-related protein, partial [Vicinamibacterales bacterium]
FAGLAEESRFYFLHSYHLVPSDPADVLAVTDYNGPFASGVRHGLIYGVQFHPEKSHHWGIRVLQNFATV